MMVCKTHKKPYEWALIDAVFESDPYNERPRILWTFDCKECLIGKGAK